MSSRSVLTLCLVAGVGALIAAAWIGYRLHSTREHTLEQARQQCGADADEARDAIARRLSAATRQIDETAAQLAASPLDRTALLGALRPIVASLQTPGAAGAALTPTAGGRQVAIALRGNQEGAVEVAVAPGYSRLPWFQSALNGERGWSEPATETPGRGPVFRYSTPIVRPGQNEPAGVLWVSGEFEGAGSTFNVFKPGPSGWGMLLARNGDVLMHPDVRLVRKSANVLNLIALRNDANLLDSVKRILSGEPMLLETDSEFSGQRAWFASRPVGDTGWVAVVARLIDDVAPHDAEFYRQLIIIAVLSVLGTTAILFWAGVLQFQRTGSVRWLWIAVAGCTVTLLVATASIRRVTFNQVSPGDVPAVKIQDGNALASFVQSAQEQNASVRTVPTGMFIQSVKFLEPRETMITGHIWQTLPANGPAPEVPGFVLPDAYEPTIARSYVRDEGERRVVGWSFESVIRQNLDVSRFPFDHDLVSVRLWPPEFSDDVLLVPDLESYPLLNPAALPGLKEDLDIAGWNTTGSFFDYEYREYSTDFGLSSRRGQGAVPQLRFNVAVKRDLLDPFIQNFVPLLVIMVMLFAVIVTTTSNVDESKLLGFNPSGTMRITSALFFVTLVAHIQLRNSLLTQEIVFLEYTYFTVYLALLVTSIHRFLFLMGALKLRVVEYRDSLVLKLLYWPAIMAVQFALTAVVFY